MRRPVRKRKRTRSASLAEGGGGGGGGGRRRRRRKRVEEEKEDDDALRTFCGGFQAWKARGRRGDAWTSAEAACGGRLRRTRSIDTQPVGIERTVLACSTLRVLQSRCRVVVESRGRVVAWLRTMADTPPPPTAAPTCAPADGGSPDITWINVAIAGSLILINGEAGAGVRPCAPASQRNADAPHVSTH